MIKNKKCISILLSQKFLQKKLLLQLEFASWSATYASASEYNAHSGFPKSRRPMTLSHIDGHIDSI